MAGSKAWGKDGKSKVAAAVLLAWNQGAVQPKQQGVMTAKRSKPAAEPTKGKGKAARAKPAPQPGRWLDRDCNAALNMQRIGESKWRPLELCYWPDQGALPAKGKEYPGLGYKRVRDEPPKAQEQQQQPAEAHSAIPRRGPLTPLPASIRFAMRRTRSGDLYPGKIETTQRTSRHSRAYAEMGNGVTNELDRDTNGCLNSQRIGESKQRPLELCSYEGLKALPPIGKEYQQGYNWVNDRLPKVRQRLHRAAEYRRGIDGWARNNA
ncbi:hypothetical protein QJQ45_011307 [Haematococcus lacustris]|nr:hypothetical protein QJQ45_011307 [Haematococcus lacustris]